MSELLGRGQWKYAWDTADWENRTNLEIAADLGMRSPERVASINVARARRRFAPLTINRFTGSHGHRGIRASAKLTPKDVRAIRELHAAGETNQAISEKYGVSQPTISRIVNRRIWRRVL